MACLQEVVVTGIGLVSALGCLESSWKKVLAGESGIHIEQPFPELAPCPLALTNRYPARLEPLTEQVVQAALQDAGLSPPLPDCAIVVGSSRGNQARWEEWAILHSILPTPHSLPSLPPTWLETLPHTAAIAAAQYIGTQVAVRSPMAACATGLWAIAQGYELIRSGEYDRVVAGAVEAPITPLTITGFQQMGALARTGAYPFDRDREGLVLGEGGAVLILESATLAKQRSAPVYGRILGFGLTADGFHVSAPEPGSRAAIAAVKRCLERSGLFPEEIDYIHAHGTATALNDRNEAHLIQTLFPHKPPTSSTKGATGHTIGASGALGAAFCLLALQQQTVPPTAGLKQSEFDLDLVTVARSTALQTALCFSFGFGGQNAAIALRR
jgi:3-oxoacyl-[acyl-carrier-protein] synthase II